MDTREALRRMRNFNKGIVEDFTKNSVTEGNHMTMRDMMGRMRKSNVNEVGTEETQPAEKVNVTPSEVEHEKQKFFNYFQDNNIDVQFEDLTVYDRGIFWGGTIDGQVQFVYKVTPLEKTSGIEINYLPDFDKSDPENQEVIKKVEEYYNDFYKYWRNNTLE